MAGVVAGIVREVKDTTPRCAVLRHLAAGARRIANASFDHPSCMHAPQEKVWFITGCSSGLGRALAARALAHGQWVIATARDVARLETLGAEHFCDRHVRFRRGAGGVQGTEHSTSPGSARRASSWRICFLPPVR
jgi:NADPH:quinone reductase-like Zn-dependent oxidoreductase